MSEQENHTLAPFEDALRLIKEDIQMMAALTEQNLVHAVEGLLTRDVDLCKRAIADDYEVNELEMKVDQEGLEIMMRYQPVASDLRNVLASMKVAGNLERISDEAKNIAKKARKILKHDKIKDPDVIKPLYDKAKAMLSDSVRAFDQEDTELAMSLEDKDHALDKDYVKTTKAFTKAMEKYPEGLKTYFLYAFVIRHLERIGDHAVNMAEDAFFVAEARDVRHGGWPEEEEEADF